MTNGLFIFIFCLTMVSISLAILNFIALAELKNKQGFQEKVHKIVKIIIIFPPFGIIFYFASELTDFFSDYFNKQDDDDLPF